MFHLLDNKHRASRHQPGRRITAIVVGAIMMAGFGSPALATAVTEEQITGLAYGTSPGQAKRLALSQIVYQVNQKISYNRCQGAIAASQTIDCTSLAYYFDFPLEAFATKAFPRKWDSSGNRPRSPEKP